MAVEILFQDKNILVCVKLPGADSEREMPELLKAQCGLREIYTVHRLDRAVGGVMVYALTSEAAAKLSAAASGNGLKKEYYAVVHGTFDDKQGTMQDLLFRDAAKNKSYVVKRLRKGVREASLDYSVEAEKGELSLVRIRLHTGRTHQIRVQFSSRKHPLVGDSRYGSPVRSDEIALWSKRLSFAHPINKKYLSFETELPGNAPWNAFTENLEN